MLWLLFVVVGVVGVGVGVGVSGVGVVSCGVGVVVVVWTMGMSGGLEAEWIQGSCCDVQVPSYEVCK